MVSRMNDFLWGGWGRWGTKNGEVERVIRALLISSNYSIPVLMNQSLIEPYIKLIGNRYRDVSWAKESSEHRP